VLCEWIQPPYKTAPVTTTSINQALLGAKPQVTVCATPGTPYRASPHAGGRETMRLALPLALLALHSRLSLAKSARQTLEIAAPFHDAMKLTPQAFQPPIFCRPSPRLRSARPREIGRSLLRTHPAPPFIRSHAPRPAGSRGPNENRAGFAQTPDFRVFFGAPRRHRDRGENRTTTPPHHPLFWASPGNSPHAKTRKILAIVRAAGNRRSAGWEEARALDNCAADLVC